METLVTTNTEQKTGTKMVKAEPKATPKPAAKAVRTRAPKTVPGFMTGFVKNTLGSKTKHGNYGVRKENGVDALYYTAFQNTWNTQEQREVRSVEGKERLAVRLESGLTLSNANRLQYCGTHVVYGGPRSYNTGQSPVQAYLEQAGAIPVPFSVFENAKLDIARAKVVVKAPSETITVEVKEWKNGKEIVKDETRHYVGACLLEIDQTFFLFDIDREELKHKVFNPFVVKLSGLTKTIEEAYLSLKPPKVVMAELEGIPVERQGEWFFIKRHDELPELHQAPQEVLAIADNPPDARKMGIEVQDGYELGGYVRNSNSNSRQWKAYDKACDKWREAQEQVREFRPNPGSLQQGENRPNNVELFVRAKDSILVSGTVSHAGREHRDVLLKGWWEPVPNTAVQSWQISGDVD